MSLVYILRMSVAATALVIAPAAFAADESKPVLPAVSAEHPAAVDAVMKKQLAELEPMMKAMGGQLAKGLDSPENRAAMEKIGKEMQSLAVTQGAAMARAMQPMMADMLPRMLRMQADMLEAMFADEKPRAETK